MRSLLSLILGEDGYQVDEAADGHQFLNALGRSPDQSERDKYRLIVTDLRMPGCSGLDVLAASRGALGQTPVIVLSAFLDDATRRLAFCLGARAVLQKPVDLDDLRTTVLSLLAPAQ